MAFSGTGPSAIALCPSSSKAIAFIFSSLAATVYKYNNEIISSRKRIRYCSVGENNRDTERKEEEKGNNENIRPETRNNYYFHDVSNDKKLINENEELKTDNNYNSNIRIRFHAKLNQIKEENKNEKNEYKPKKFIRFRISTPKKEVIKEVDSEDVKVDEEEDDQNKNEKENRDSKQKEKDQNKIFKRFRSCQYKDKTIGKEVKDDSNNQKNNNFINNYNLSNNIKNNITINNNSNNKSNSQNNYNKNCIVNNYNNKNYIRNNSKNSNDYNSNNKNSNSSNNNKNTIDNNNNKNIIDNKNNDDICPAVPENVGLKNLVGLTDKLLNHMKRRINNIFVKCKIPIFNIEEYTINKKLGEGSYGIIFSVNKQNQKSPIYALKKIIARTITEVDTFIKEFELVYSCDHPNIMKIYGLSLRILDTTTFAIYVLMEKSKCDWNKEIKLHLSKRKIYSEKELINILKQLTEALLFLKNKLNISHRDIKPQNILIFDDGKYKLADFGEAKEVKISKKLNTLRGTELYMSPALYEGLKRDKTDVIHDPFKSDVFSLGFCFLFAAGLNFNILYQVREQTDNNIIEKYINNHLKKMYSNTFIEIICKMLKVEEAKRFGFSEILEYIKDNYH